MGYSYSAHISDHHVDLYALRRLPASQAADLEEHLLLCEACRDRLNETERFIAALRRAANELDPSTAPMRRPVAVAHEMGRFRPSAFIPLFFLTGVCLMCAMPDVNHRQMTPAQSGGQSIVY